MMLNKSDPEKDQSLNDINLDMSSTPLQDSVSSIQWMPALQNGGVPPNIFAVGTWDGSVRVYQVGQSINGVSIQQKAVIKIPSPVLSVSWNAENNGLFVGCGDNTLRAVDLATSQVINIGKHNNAVKDVFYVPFQNLVLSTSYDKIVNCWQVGNQNPVFSFPVNNKIYTSAFKYPIFAGGLSQEKLLLFDITNINLKSYLDSPLGKQSQIQSVTLHNDKDTFGMGSIDGRANLSTLTKSPNGEIKLSSIMTFKSNKVEQNGKSILYPVNAVGFNSRNKKWFLTGGADGYMQYWDYEAKNKIKQFSYLKNPITAAKVNFTGELIVYALGNDWHMGPQGIGKWKPKIAVHYIKQDEMKYNK